MPCLLPSAGGTLEDVIHEAQKQGTRFSKEVIMRMLSTVSSLCGAAGNNDLDMSACART